MNNNNFKSGFVALIGRPNVGKSTLLNKLMAKKISITAPKPQTTRSQITGIKTTEFAQTIYIDTPGIKQQEKYLINRYLNRIALSVLVDADILVFVIDSYWHAEDNLLLKKITELQLNKPLILAINKIDTIKNKRQLLKLLQELASKAPWLHLVPISAKNAENLPRLENLIAKNLPPGELLYPAEQTTTYSLNFQLSEIIREKIIHATRDEVPYSTMVIIDQINPRAKLTEIHAIIWVERAGQKAIIIGKAGDQLKKIGQAARIEIERLLGVSVFLRLWVKLKKQWTLDEQILRTRLE